MRERRRRDQTPPPPSPPPPPPAGGGENTPPPAVVPPPFHRGAGKPCAPASPLVTCSPFHCFYALPQRV
ncbi:hypothetical protein FZI21_18805 [Cronobacter sakazakii]|nr:hypothetical protein FZI21_18805 [Cronobacter sakazakii]